MNTKRRIIACFLTIFIFSLATVAFAADLSVKEKKINEGSVKITLPVFSGANGGTNIDNLATVLYAKNVIESLNEFLPEDKQYNINNDLPAILKAKDPAVASYEAVKALAKEVNIKLIAEHNSVNTAAKKYYVNCDYYKAMATKNIVSAELVTDYYTGGAHASEIIKALNLSMNDGRVLTLQDFFIKDSDYKSRLNMLIEIQRKGDARVFKDPSKVIPVQPVSVTGNEKFIFKNDINNFGFTIFYNPGEIAPIAKGAVEYPIGIDTVSDIISYDIK